MCNPIRLPSIDDRYPSSSAKERVQLPSLEEIIPDFNPHYRPSFIQGLHHDRPLPSDQQLNGRTRATSYDHNYQHSKHHSHNFNNSNAPVYLDRPVHAFPQNYTSSQYCSSAYPSTSASHPSSASSSSSISSVSQSSVFNANRTRSSIGALPSSSSSISSISSYNPQHKLPSSASLGDPNSSYSAQTSPSHFGYLGGYSTRAPSGSGAAGAIINGPSAGFGPVNLSTSPDIGSGTYGSGAAVGGASLIDLHGHNKKKEIKRRTRTGCLTCRKRRIKCDERKPFCLNCEKSKKECMGYEKKYVVNDKKPGDKLLLSSHNQHQHQHPSQHQHPYHAQQHILHMHKFQLVMNN